MKGKKDEKVKGKKGDENQHEGDQAKKLGASKSEAGANSEQKINYLNLSISMIKCSKANQIKPVKQK